MQKSTALDLNRPNPSLSMASDFLKQTSVNSFKDRRGIKSRRDSLNQQKEKIIDLKIKIEDNLIKNPTDSSPKRLSIDNRTGGFHSNHRASVRLAKIPQRDYKNMTAQMFLQK